jgi:hypothetical protein
VHRCKLQRPDEEPHHPKRRTVYKYQQLFFTLVVRMGVRRGAERSTAVAKRWAKSKSVDGVSERSGGEEERTVAIAHRSEARGGVIVRGPDAIVCRRRVLRRERGPTVRAPIYAAASRVSLLDVC